MPKVLSAEYQILGQRDARWGAKLVGNSKSENLHNMGCLLTCYSMIAGCTPDVMNDALTPQGFKQEPSGAWLKTHDIPQLPRVSKMVYVSGWYTGDVPAVEMKKAQAFLADGGALTLLVDPTPGNPGLQRGEQHWVLAVGLTDDGKMVIHDPWFGDATMLSLRYEWKGGGDKSAIYFYRAYQVYAQNGGQPQGDLAAPATEGA